MAGKPRNYISEHNKYNEIDYWNKRKMPNSATKEGTNKHIKFIRDNIKDGDEVLELGPGVGRTFDAYRGMAVSVYGYDISRKYKDVVTSKARSLCMDFKLVIGDIIGPGLPYKNKEFDKAVAVSVLLHQRPENIIPVMSELARVAKHVIAISWYDQEKEFNRIDIGPVNDTYCFNYDYPKICKKMGWNMVKQFIWNRQLFFVYSSDSVSL